MSEALNLHVVFSQSFPISDHHLFVAAFSNYLFKPCRPLWKSLLTISQRVNIKATSGQDEKSLCSHESSVARFWNFHWNFYRKTSESLLPETNQRAVIHRLVQSYRHCLQEHEKGGRSEVSVWWQRCSLSLINLSSGRTGVPPRHWEALRSQLWLRPL